MTVLYNCRHDGDQYRISKFDNDMNVESSYLCDTDNCECPAGVRPTCRHRQMLPKFISRSHVGDEWMFDFDRGGWVQQGPEWAQQEQIEGLDEGPTDVEGLEEAYGTGQLDLSDLPEGITAIVLDHPDKVVDVHNVIAEAVGEPSAKHIKRRL